jgi:phage baseplate assembly protein V
MNAAARLRLMVARGLVNLINDAGGLQRLQVEALDNEPLDGVERVQNFGHTSHPPRGSMPVLVAVGGSRDHMVAVAVDNEEHRPRDLQEGESAMYNAHGVRLLFDQDGKQALDWGLSGVPETYLVDAQGIVRLHFRRPINERDVTEAILPLIKGGK